MDWIFAIKSTLFGTLLMLVYPGIYLIAKELVKEFNSTDRRNTVLNIIKFIGIIVLVIIFYINSLFNKDESRSTFNIILCYILGIGSPMLFLVYILNVDKYHAKSISRILDIFLAGIYMMYLTFITLNIILPLIAGIKNYYAILNTTSNIKSNFISSYLFAGCIEEWFKLFFILFLLHVTKTSKSRYDVLLFSVAMGILFAGIENVIIPDYFKPKILIIRTFTAVPIHILLAFVMHYFVYLIINTKKLFKKILLLFPAWLVPASVHGTYNFSIPYLQMFAKELSKYFLSTIAIGLFLFFFVFLIRKHLVSINKMDFFEVKENT